MQKWLRAFLALVLTFVLVAGCTTEEGSASPTIETNAETVVTTAPTQ